jgi:hypothetical protein
MILKSVQRFSECRCEFRLRRRVCPHTATDRELAGGTAQGQKSPDLFRPAPGFSPIHNPKFIQLKSLGFLSEMFRRGGSGETILRRKKPFFRLRADVPKPSLTNNFPNERR